YWAGMRWKAIWRISFGPRGSGRNAVAAEYLSVIANLRQSGCERRYGKRWLRHNVSNGLGGGRDVAGRFFELHIGKDQGATVILVHLIQARLELLHLCFRHFGHGHGLFRSCL